VIIDKFEKSQQQKQQQPAAGQPSQALLRDAERSARLEKGQRDATAKQEAYRATKGGLRADATSQQVRRDDLSPGMPTLPHSPSIIIFWVMHVADHRYGTLLLPVHQKVCQQTDSMQCIPSRLTAKVPWAGLVWGVHAYVCSTTSAAAT
jgi:hypothetical protein